MTTTTRKPRHPNYKRIVLARYPKAKAVQSLCGNFWFIDQPPGWPLGLGQRQSEAWMDAALTIERRKWWKDGAR